MSPKSLVPFLVMVPRPLVVLASLTQPLTLPVVSRVAAPRTLLRLHMAVLVHPWALPVVVRMVPALTLVKSTAPTNPLASLDTPIMLLVKFPIALYSVAMFPMVNLLTVSLNVVVPAAAPLNVPMVLLVPLATCMSTTVSRVTAYLPGALLVLPSSLVSLAF